ncbi:MAG: HAD-IC family P-type ATPase, partial [Coriobacteriales bacterium]|nr:HAD-IC family P-type ATPase [Coriobacteriales bacterium]
MSITISIPIGGMTCTVCAQRIEKALLKVNGVSDATVNYASEKAVVTYDRDLTDINQLRQVIKQTGYKVLSTSLSDSLAADQLYHAKEIRTGWIKLALAALATLPLLYLAMVPMLPAQLVSVLPYPGFLRPDLYPFANAFIQLVLCQVAVVIGYRFYVEGFRAVIKLAPSMDTLIALGTGAAMVYSLVNTVLIAFGEHHLVHSLYYEAAATIITLILLGRNLEAMSKGRAGEAIKSLMRLAPRTAVVLRDGSEIVTPVDAVEPGDLILVRPGARIPVDGSVFEGTSTVDESVLSGESLPVDKSAGDMVYAGTQNTTGAFSFIAQMVGVDTALAKIIAAVEEAQGRKAPIARLADRVAGVFVPVVLVIAILASAAWYLAVTYAGFPLPQGTDVVSFVINILVSVLIIACPCALGLATPVAIMVGSYKGAALGILIKSGEALEKAGIVNTVVMDKTGTLTSGRPTLTEVIPAAGLSRWGGLRSKVIPTAELPAASAEIQTELDAASVKEQLDFPDVITEVPVMQHETSLSGIPEDDLLALKDFRLPQDFDISQFVTFDIINPFVGSSARRSASEEAVTIEEAEIIEAGETTGAIATSDSIDTFETGETAGAIATSDLPSEPDVDRVYFNLIEEEATLQSMVQADNDLVLMLAASAERNSEHPLAKAVVDAADDRGLVLLPIERFISEPGKGVRAYADAADSIEILVGNRLFMQESFIDTSGFASLEEAMTSSGKTTVYVAACGELAGIMSLADTLKPRSKAAIKRLKQKGYQIMLLTGDNRRTAEAIASELEIENVISEVLPQDKAAEIAKLRKAGSVVAMVGDGINDAPALIEADLGLAVGSGTDIAIESADIVLMHSDPRDIPRALNLSRQTLQTIKQNLFWAFAFNSIAIPIAAGALYAFGG